MAERALARARTWLMRGPASPVSAAASPPSLALALSALEAPRRDERRSGASAIAAHQLWRPTGCAPTHSCMCVTTPRVSSAAVIIIWALLKHEYDACAGHYLRAATNCGKVGGRGWSRRCTSRPLHLNPLPG